jgi:hypothetical protein
MVLLLEKPLPFVFIPDPIGLRFVRGHIVVLGHLPPPRKRVFAQSKWRAELRDALVLTSLFGVVELRPSSSKRST